MKSSDSQTGVSGMKSLRIQPGGPLHGIVRVPGDKSISHRYAILGAMADGTSRISNYSASQDCQSTLNCLEQLGSEISREDDIVTITGPGWQNLSASKDSLDTGNSGTTFRLLSGVLAGRPFSSTIDGDASLRRRPMQRILSPLRKMGARITAREGEFPPLHIHGSQLTGIDYQPDVASAQVKSCILLAGLTASRRTTVVEILPTRDHTERALPLFGVTLERTGLRTAVAGNQTLRGASVEVPADFSSASFFIVAALVSPDSNLRLPGIGLNPSRTGLLTLLQEAGADIQVDNLRQMGNEPVGDLWVRFGSDLLKRFPSQIGGRWIPNIIDEIPLLAVLATRLEKGLSVVEAGELRKKESDRIHSIVHNLTALGVEVEERPDGFQIPGRQRIRGGKVRTFGDHRIAMAFAVAALTAESEVQLDDAGCAGVSFPGFFSELHKAASPAS